MPPPPDDTSISGSLCSCRATLDTVVIALCHHLFDRRLACILHFYIPAERRPTQRKINSEPTPSSLWLGALQTLSRSNSLGRGTDWLGGSPDEPTSRPTDGKRKKKKHFFQQSQHPNPTTRRKIEIEAKKRDTYLLWWPPKQKVGCNEAPTPCYTPARRSHHTGILFFDSVYVPTNNPTRRCRFSAVQINCSGVWLRPNCVPTVDAISRQSKDFLQLLHGNKGNLLMARS